MDQSDSPEPSADFASNHMALGGLAAELEADSDAAGNGPHPPTGVHNTDAVYRKWVSITKRRSRPYASLRRRFIACLRELAGESKLVDTANRPAEAKIVSCSLRLQ